MRPRVKVCCIASVEEARAAVECGAEAVRPFGLDVCSGVRREERLDEEILRRFFARLA
jgi:phosphoribosylanthranilate isomerase